MSIIWIAKVLFFYEISCNEHKKSDISFILLPKWLHFLSKIFKFNFSYAHIRTKALAEHPNSASATSLITLLTFSSHSLHSSRSPHAPLARSAYLKKKAAPEKGRPTERLFNLYLTET